ncbi:hypothetical protein JTB14_030931 [Gonioctena quinquepunctata]|nr:hypothetical protein JTB14_030931 [Gonioctena quinquepunctata]
MVNSEMEDKQRNDRAVWKSEYRQNGESSDTRIYANNFIKSKQLRPVSDFENRKSYQKGSMYAKVLRNILGGKAIEWRKGYRMVNSEKEDKQRNDRAEYRQNGESSDTRIYAHNFIKSKQLRPVSDFENRKSYQKGSMYAKVLRNILGGKDIEW